MTMPRPISRRRYVTGLLAGAALAAPALRTRAADPIQLKFATADTMNDTSYSVAQHFAAEVAQRTGRRRREIYQSALALQKSVKKDGKHGAPR